MGLIVVGGGTFVRLLHFSIVRSHRGDATSQSSLRFRGPSRFLRRQRPFRPYRWWAFGLRFRSFWVRFRSFRLRWPSLFGRRACRRDWWFRWLWWLAFVW